LTRAYSRVNTIALDTSECVSSPAPPLDSFSNKYRLKNLSKIKIVRIIVFF
jgi:hypothetical protein